MEWILERLLHSVEDSKMDFGEDSCVEDSGVDPGVDSVDDS